MLTRRCAIRSAVFDYLYTPPWIALLETIKSGVQYEAFSIINFWSIYGETSPPLNVISLIDAIILLSRVAELCCRICHRRLRYILMPLCQTRCSVLPLSYCVFHSAPLACVRHSGNANLTDTPSSHSLQTPIKVQVSNCRSQCCIESHD